MYINWQQDKRTSIDAFDHIVVVEHGLHRHCKGFVAASVSLPPVWAN